MKREMSEISSIRSRHDSNLWEILSYIYIKR